MGMKPLVLAMIWQENDGEGVANGLGTPDAGHDLAKRPASDMAV